MDELVYVIDETQTNAIRNRILIRMYKFMAVVILPIATLEYFSWKNNGVSFWLITIGFTAYLMLIYYISANKAAKAYKTFKIVLGKEGVERKADKMPYIMIPWIDLGIEEKPNQVTLYDKNVSSFTRWMYGKGRIIVPAEILNKESLLNELYKHGIN